MPEKNATRDELRSTIRYLKDQIDAGFDRVDMLLRALMAIQGILNEMHVAPANQDHILKRTLDEMLRISRDAINP